MGVEDDKAELLCRVDFPLYTVAMISDRHLLVAGGGGSANTGVKNGFEIFEITTDGAHCSGTSVYRFYTGEHAVMTLSARPNLNNNSPLKVSIATGQNQFCQVYSISLARERKMSERRSMGGAGDQPAAGLVRRSQANGVPGQMHNSSADTRVEPINLVFKAEPVKRVQIDFNEKEPYGKVVRISSNGKLMASGGDDGHLRVWTFPELSKLHDFATHEKEIDDIDFSPDSSRICSISKDRRAIVWDVKKGKKHAEMSWEANSNIKYMYKRVRFGSVEGDHKKYKVFTISNPVGSSKAPAILHKWNTQSYTVETTVKSPPGVAYSALAVCDSGNYVATGSMSEGIVDIYTAFNLALLKRVRNSHSTFITGLEFLPTGEESAPARGFSDASVVSISVDHQVCIHSVPPIKTVSSFTAMLLVVLVLVGTFILASYLGL